MEGGGEGEERCGVLCMEHCVSESCGLRHIPAAAPQTINPICVYAETVH